MKFNEKDPVVLERKRVEVINSLVDLLAFTIKESPEASSLESRVEKVKKLFRDSNISLEQLETLLKRAPDFIANN